MPRIQQYQSQVDAAGPAQRKLYTPDDFGAQKDEATEQLGQTVSKVGQAVQQRAEQADVSSASVALANLQAQHTIKVQNAMLNGDPNDPNLASDLNKDYADAASDIRANIATSAGQEYFDKANANLSTEFQVRAHSVQAQLAGEKAKNDFEQARSSRAAALLADPSQYQATKDLQNVDLDSLVGKIPQTHIDAERYKSQQMLAEAAVRGYIEMNPNDAKKQLDAGTWDSELSGDLRHQLQREAKVAVTGQLADQARAQALQEKALAAAQDVTKGQYLDQLYNPKNPNGMLTSKQILNGNLDPASKEHFINILQRNATDGDNPKNPALFNSTIARIQLPDGDPNKITNEDYFLGLVAKGEIPYADAVKLRSEFQGRKTETGQMEAVLKDKFFNDVAKSQITKSNPGLGLLDTAGDERLYNFRYLAEKKIAEQRSAGRPMEDLYNPKSQDYLGKYIPQFQVGANQIINDYTKKMSAPSADATTKAIPRKPGETPAQYLKRIGQQN